jgi:predicted nucleotidyltransferase
VRDGNGVQALTGLNARRSPIGWEIVTLEGELSREVGVSVDLVPRQGLRPLIGQRILREVAPV